ncbi:hypothetical protein [Acinetobacter pittii]|uniref:hypothetical protein n=1 Tax=Acinetobacter pittii TaxID=48296 RepID=UPI0024DEDB7F|nr:hypothetical protein [Acinetobacter pittii]
MGFWNSLANASHVEVSFSKNKDIEEIQKKVEELKLHQAIKNIVNTGNPTQDEKGTAELESCIINYQPITNSLNQNDSVLAKIIMQDGSVLYESLLKLENGSRTRYTETFRFGNWVDRFLKYSEELTTQHLAEFKKKLLEEQQEKMKPFSEIDF